MNDEHGSSGQPGVEQWAEKAQRERERERERERLFNPG
jgi:hypothetical protein